MKLSCYEGPDGAEAGVYSDAGLIRLSGALRARYPSVRSVLEQDGLDDVHAWADGRAPDLKHQEVRFLPPLHDADKIVCVGVNYPKRHPVEGEVPPPKHITLFPKWSGSLVGHLEPVIRPSGEPAETFDYEGELVLVIGPGKPGMTAADFPVRHVAKENAFDVIAGYTIMDDGSVRGWQKHSVPAGKNFTASGASGPCMVTADEIEDPFAMQLSTRLNGEQVQSATPNDMIFDIPTIIAYVTNIMTLRPGDIIATGSPEGSGGSRQPQRFLVPGDELEIEWTGIGVLKTRVVNAA